jgi:aminopeptidase N
MADTTATGDILGRDEAARRADLLDDIAYDVDLDLGDGRGDTFASTTRATFSCSEPGARTFIDCTAETVGSVTLNGRRLGADAVADHRLWLDDLAETNELVVEARFAFRHTGTGLHRFVDPADDAVYLHSQFEPFDAHTVYACFDQPDCKARLTLTVRAPSAWTVVSNEPVGSRTSDGDGIDVWRFGQTPVMSTYITALVAGPLHAVIDDSGPVPLGLYCRASLAEYLEPDEMFEVTRAGMEFFAEVFGRPYPFTKYDQLFVPEFNWGAMENAGCVTFSERYLFRSRVTTARRTSRASTVLHELGHMWFGDLVTMRWWGDLWLNESFATYVSYWALAERTRFSTAWVQFFNAMLSWAVSQDQLPTTHPIVADAPDTDTALNNFDGITYAKGALVLTQLVAWVGVDAFREGLQDYFARHAWGNAELGDFLAALERSSGRALEPWSRQWLQTTGVTTLTVDADVDADDRYAKVSVVQRTGDDQPAPRDQRIAVGLFDVDAHGAVTRRSQTRLDVTGERTVVSAVAGEPRADLLLPNDGLRSYTKVRLDPRSLATVEQHLSGIVDPLARAQCWMIAWDLLRDAELPARRYVDLVARHAAAEAEPEILRMLVGRAQAAASRYGAPALRDRTTTQLATAARAAFVDVAPGSDDQLVWARCRMAVDDPQWTLDLLDDRRVPEGLAVDHDLRWTALTELARRGVAGEDRIAAEVDRDPTDEGQRRATTARAAQPDPDAKEHAWRLARDPHQPLAMRRAACAGFHQYDQVALLRPYVERYVDELPELWEQLVRQESLDLTEGLFPMAVVEPATVSAAERALAQPIPEAGTRLVVEQLDELRRTLRTREADGA